MNRQVNPSDVDLATCAGEAVYTEILQSQAIPEQDGGELEFPVWQGQQPTNAVVWTCGRKATKVCFPFGLVVHTGGLKKSYLLVTSHLILATCWLTVSFAWVMGPKLHHYSSPIKANSSQVTPPLPPR